MPVIKIGHIPVDVFRIRKIKSKLKKCIKKILYALFAFITIVTLRQDKVKCPSSESKTNVGITGSISEI
jgi:hypothetical protein